MGAPAVGPRVVLDSNAVVSALVFRYGRLAWLREAWRAGHFVPLASKATTEEIVRVLAYPKFELSSEDIEALLADYLPFIETVAVSSGLAVPEPPDPGDKIFVVLALVANADFLVTGDQPLLTMGAVGACRIVTPAQFRAVLEGREQV